MGTILGEFEHLVLLAVLQLGDEAYGMAITDLIAERTGREVSFGAVYTTLRRMKRKDLVSAATGTPEPVRGGRAKTYFRPTPEGLDALREAQTAISAMADGLDLAGGEAGVR